MSAMLEVKDLSVAYGKILAVKDVSFTVNQGEIVTLIGSNGAGKSTTLRTISGLLHPRTGSVAFKGETISGKARRNYRQHWSHPIRHLAHIQ